MKQKLLYFLALFLSLIYLPVKAQQPTLEWAKRFNGKGSASDHAVSIAVDAAGNSYVTGYSWIADYPLQTTTIKYAPTGEQLWAVQFEGKMMANDIAVDAHGGVYVTGNTTYFDWELSIPSDFITVRYDAATGQQTWASIYAGPAGKDDEVRAITVDNQGGVYVTGVSSGGATNYDFATIRYDAATGQQTWAQRYNRSDNFNDIPAAIAVDQSGGVYVTGGSSNGSRSDFATIRYDALSGRQAWIRYYNGPDNDSDAATDLAVDNKGGVYVTGYSYSMVGSSKFSEPDFATLRYDAVTGRQTWVRRHAGSTGYDEPSAIAVDNQGGVFVTGTSESDFVTIRYQAATGQQTWLRHYNSPLNGFDSSTDIAVDNLGGVYVTGFSHDPGTNENTATLRYDAATGAQSWAQRNNGAFYLATGDGDLYVAGSTYANPANDYDFATIRYDGATGQQVWAQTHDNLDNTNDTPVALAVDEEGNSYVTGSSFIGGGHNRNITVVKYAPSGEQLWVAQYAEGMLARGSEVRAIAVDNRGGIYVTGYSYFEETGSDYLTIRFDAATGERSWAQSYNAIDSNWDAATAIAVDNSGGVYVTGSSSIVPFSVYLDYTTIRYDAATGRQTWISRYDGPLGFSDRPTAIAVDNKGGIFVTGETYTRNLGATGFATLRYDAATGRQVWVSLFAGNSESQAHDIVVDDKDGVYVTGTSTIRYEAASGRQVWANATGGAIALDKTGNLYATTGAATYRYDAATGKQVWKNEQGGLVIDVDSQGGVYVAGTAKGRDNGPDYQLYRFSAATGELFWAERYDSPNRWEKVEDIALDTRGNVIVTGYSKSPETGFDFLTVKYSQCLPLAKRGIQGSPTAAVNTAGATYSMTESGASGFTWSITDGEGKAYHNFKGQGTARITVKWPPAPDVYKVSLTYSAGCHQADTVLYVHVFDPKAGFVTGGGWVASPASPAYEFMQTSTKAYFGLMAKYKKGEENRVQGETQLLLANGSFYFRGSAHEGRTLVVAGNRAFYRGRGTVTYRDDKGTPVTDSRRFGFLVAATDGQLGKATGSDKLRILVWELKKDGSRGATVYDNQAGCATNLDENREACSVISGGNIVIHQNGMKGLSSLSALVVAASESFEPGLQAYPTKFSDRTTLAFATEEANAYQLELYDTKGTLVRQIATGSAEVGRRYEHELRAEGLAKGMYLVRLTSGTFTQTIKLVVQH